MTDQDCAPRAETPQEKGERRAEIARATDDHELLEGAEDAPSFGSRSGGRIAQNVGTQDELNQALGADDAGTTRVKSGDKGGEPNIPTRADNKNQNV